MGLEMAQQLGIPATASRVLGTPGCRVPSNHMGAQHHLEPQYKRIQLPFLAATGTRHTHVVHRHTHRQDNHTHKKTL